MTENNNFPQHENRTTLKYTTCESNAVVLHYNPVTLQYSKPVNTPPNHLSNNIIKERYLIVAHIKWAFQIDYEKNV
jgi:hypothetical protein